MCSMNTYLKYIGIIGTIVLCITFSVKPLFAFAGYENGDEDNTLTNEVESTSSQTPHDMTHEEITSLTQSFMDMIVQDIDDHYQVKDYNSKEEILKEFEKISTRDVAEPYVEFYFEEKKDGLYIIPTETPPWFNPDNDYDIITSNKTVQVIQDNESDINGKYTVQYEMTYGADGWKITNIEHL